MVRIEIPYHLRQVSGADRIIQLPVPDPVTQRSILDTLEAAYPMLRGTIRNPLTGERRPFIRFFACGEDFSHELPDTPLPENIANGTDIYRIVGAMAGG